MLAVSSPLVLVHHFINDELKLCKIAQGFGEVSSFYLVDYLLSACHPDALQLHHMGC